MEKPWTFEDIAFVIELGIVPDMEPEEEFDANDGLGVFRGLLSAFAFYAVASIVCLALYELANR